MKWMMLTNEDLKQELDVLERFVEELPENAMRFGVRILLTVVFFFVGTRIIKLIRKILKKSLERAKADRGVVQFLDAFVKASMYIVLVVMLAMSFGLDAAGVVAILGSAGVAIGLALQGSLSNLAGGVLILLLKPFKVGDFITESTHNQSGTVDEIGLFYTKLLMPDNKIIVMPNGMLANNGIVNATAMKKRRLDVSVGIAYDSDIKKAKEALLSLLQKDEAVLKEEEIAVFVDTLAESSIVLTLRCWLTNEDYWEGKWRITEAVKYALDEAGIAIPFPQMDVRISEK